MPDVSNMWMSHLKQMKNPISTNHNIIIKTESNSNKELPIDCLEKLFKYHNEQN